MSENNVQLARRLYEAHSSGNLEAAVESVCDPEIGGTPPKGSAC
jgi:hypothetical protein